MTAAITRGAMNMMSAVIDMGFAVAVAGFPMASLVVDIPVEYLFKKREL